MASLSGTCKGCPRLVILLSPAPPGDIPFKELSSGRGGIGRRATLRSLWDNIPWKFESSRPHQSFKARYSFARVLSYGGVGIRASPLLRI